MAGIVDKIQKMWNPPEDEYDDYYDDEGYEDDEEDTAEPERTQSSYQEDHQSAPSLFRRSNKVVNMNQKAQLQVVVFKPMSFGEDTRDIAQALINRSAVVVNLERTPKDDARRILDFLSGVAFAQNGKIKRIATSTFIITPYNVDLTGDDLFDEFENNGVYF